MLRIYNTLTHEKTVFSPMQPGTVRMYVCGLTTYDFAHIGHARMLVAFDVVVRYLRASGLDVTYVRNITDIDDKIIQRANENGESIDELTERFIAATHEDEAALGIERPDIEPRATGYIEQIIDMVRTLEEKGFAYAADNGDVYFEVTRYPEYARLSRRKPDELLAGARIEVGEAKKDPRDFVLWKASKDNEPGWASPWGRGRPGWHIECSAMSTSTLGDTFDIHGGGSDLMFPHHDNEIAQSCCATGSPFVHTWMHNGPVRVDDEKMSKSLGNFFTVREVLKVYPAEVIRYFLLSSHYRSAINYSEDNLQTARGALERFYHALKGRDLSVEGVDDAEYEQRFRTAMDDDFNTPEALGVLFELVRAINRHATDDTARADALAVTLRRLGGFLGILQQTAETFLRQGAGDVDPARVEELIEARNQARRDRDFARADEIRDELSAMGVVLEDSRAGTTWRIERQ